MTENTTHGEENQKQKSKQQQQQQQQPPIKLCHRLFFSILTTLPQNQASSVRGHLPNSIMSAEHVQDLYIN